ncbi:MAG: SEC-C domain-containing protein, partial [Oscillospiraceae bacterium]|nr:SEC-C domain-containing protein [Oscillospiraceae bacterium]
SVESRNFQSRKSTLEYDDVMNKQRELIYGQRKNVLDGADLQKEISSFITNIISETVHGAFGENKHIGQEAYRTMLASLEGSFFPKDAVRFTPEEVEKADADTLAEAFTAKALETYAAKAAEIDAARESNPGIPDMRELERVVMLRVVDEYWMEHIDAMQDLRQGIRLQAYAQSNPVDAYKRESLHMFEEMVAAIQEETVRRLYSMRLRTNQEVKRERVASGITEGRGDGTVKKQPRRVQKVGRNDPCPCGSGKKYKKCCGREE